MGKKSNLKGRLFEDRVESLLRQAEQACPTRIIVQPQKSVALRDGRSKVVDFVFRYETMASANVVGVECQHRDAWSSEILDKILSLRNHSLHNRFWFVYETDGFLSTDTREILDGHGVMHFSLSALERHIHWVIQDVLAAEQRCRDIAALNAANPANPAPERYDLQGTPTRIVDPAMISRSR